MWWAEQTRGQGERKITLLHLFNDKQPKASQPVIHPVFETGSSASGPVLVASDPSRRPVMPSVIPDMRRGFHPTFHARTVQTY